MAPIRLSDLIVASLDEDRVSTIIQLVQDDPDMTPDQRTSSLVLTGIAYGADEAQRRIHTEAPQHVEFLRSLIDGIDTALDEATSLQASAALAAVRTPIAERLAQLLNESRGAFAARAYTVFGVGQDVIFSDVPGQEFPKLDRLGLGLEMLRRNAAIVLGWHLGQTRGHPSGMTCFCPGCYSQLFDKSGVSEEVTLRQMLADHGSMDAALSEFGTYLINVLQEEASKASEGMSDLHSIDPKASADYLKEAIDRIKGK